MKLHHVALALLVLLMACNQHVENPKSAAYPCGTRAHMCSSGGCCWNSQDCGADTAGCPPDMCCAGSGTLYGASGPTNQWRPGEK